MKTAEAVFKQALDQLGFSSHKPSEMSNSDYWLCTSTAMQLYARQVAEQALKDAADRYRAVAMQDDFGSPQDATESILSTPIETP